MVEITQLAEGEGALVQSEEGDGCLVMVVATVLEPRAEGEGWLVSSEGEGE